MSIASQTRMIDELTEKAVAALAANRHFEAEVHANQAMLLARDDSDFERMAIVVPTLRDSRLRRLSAAMDIGTVTVVDVPFEDDVNIDPGCYILQPPLVGAQARRLRHMAVGREIDAVVLCREPVIRPGLVPMVALGSGATVRTKMHLPGDIENPDLEWYAEALEALGEAGGELDPAMAVVKRVDALLTRVDAIPEHAGLHIQLEEACRRATEERAAEAS